MAKQAFVWRQWYFIIIALTIDRICTTQIVEGLVDDSGLYNVVAEQVVRLIIISL